MFHVEHRAGVTETLELGTQRGYKQLTGESTDDPEQGCESRAIEFCGRIIQQEGASSWVQRILNS